MINKPALVKVRLPHAALPTANWADCYELAIDAPTLTATEAAKVAIGHFPWWVRLLMRIRDRVVGAFGLKTSAHQMSGQDDMIGIFPVVSRKDHEIVLGFDDRHLDFRIVISVRTRPDGRQVVSATTLVDRKIVLGKIYIVLVTPFHKMIVMAMLGNLCRLPALT